MHVLKQRTRGTARRAFTLIEIMVATVIMVILVGLVVQITSEVLKVWTRSSGKLTANAEARIAMDIITQDLETAVFRNNGLQWLRSENLTLSGPGGNGTATVALRLFSPALDRPDGPGDICAIAYQLDYVDPIDGQPGDPIDRSFVLYRLVVNPKDTFDNIMGKGNQEALPDQSSTIWGTESIAGDSGGNYLVSNIVSFEVDFYVEDDGDTSTDTLLAGDTLYGGTDATVGPQATLPQYQKMLSYAEVSLTVISGEGAQMLQNIDKIPETAGEVILQHGEVFTRRVNFMAHPL
jgi:prepilin-type N-terminal cleavage/methylation domain-containing protein